MSHLSGTPLAPLKLTMSEFCHPASHAREAAYASPYMLRVQGYLKRQVTGVRGNRWLPSYLPLRGACAVRLKGRLLVVAPLVIALLSKSCSLNLFQGRR